MEDATHEAARRLEEVDAIRRRVVNVVGHALRTPVTTLCGMAEALALEDDEETRRALADAVVRNARVVERLLDQLLIAADVSTALPVGERRPISVPVAVVDALDQLGLAGVTVDADGAVACVRPAALEQVLLLVLDNGVKYGEGTLRVTARSDDGTTAIEVATEGDKPSDEEIDLAFELFYRGEHAVMRSAGLGTGLTVARTLARLEGGDVTMFRRGDSIVTSIDLPA